jgi:hypothetical protein
MKLEQLTEINRAVGELGSYLRLRARLADGGARLLLTFPSAQSQRNGLLTPELSDAIVHRLIMPLVDRAVPPVSDEPALPDELQGLILDKVVLPWLDIKVGELTDKLREAGIELGSVDLERIGR